MRTINLILLLALLMGCKKKESFTSNKGNVENNPITSNLKLIWKKPFSDEPTNCWAIKPFIWSNHVIMGYAPGGDGFKISLYDGKTGDISWTWENFMSYPIMQNDHYNFVYEDFFVFNNNNETGVIDLKSGKSEWQYLVPNNDGAPGISDIGEYIYHKHKSSNWPSEYVHLVRSPISHVSWDTIFTLYTDSLNGYSPAICGPTLWMNPEGDSILLYQNRSYKFGSNPDGQIDFYAYNLSLDEIEFVLKDIEPTGNSNAMPPFVDGDRVYILGNRNLHCIDLITQKIIWQKGFPGFGHHLMLSNLIVVGNKLIVKPDNDRIYAFNKYDGTMIWYTSDAGSTPSHMKYYKGMVFYTSEGTGKLFAVSIHTGKIIWAEDSPHDHNSKYPSAGFQDGVAINEDLGYIYAQDKYFMMCFKAPKPY